MATGSPRMRAILALFAAHRELSALEWLEFRQAMVGAVVWFTCVAMAGLAAWLAANAALVVAFRDQPLGALGAVIAVNFVAASIGILRVRSLLRRPFFALTKREAERDVQTVMKVLS